MLSVFRIQFNRSELTTCRFVILSALKMCNAQSEHRCEEVREELERLLQNESPRRRVRVRADQQHSVTETITARIVDPE